MKQFLLFIFVFFLGGFFLAQQPFVYKKKITDDPYREAYDMYASSISLSDGYLAVGIGSDKQDSLENNPLLLAGSVRMYKKMNNDWFFTKKITAPDRGTGDHFGGVVKISNNQLFISSFNALDSLGNNPLLRSGAVYVYNLVAGDWILGQKIVAFDRNGDEEFGSSISIDGNTMLISAGREEKDSLGVVGAPSGAAYFYEKDMTGRWNFVQKISAFDKQNEDYFGAFSCFVKGNYAVVGAHKQDLDANGGNSISNAGAAYIFKKVSGVWQFHKKIVEGSLFTRFTNANFGSQVLIEGDNILVSAPRMTVNGANQTVGVVFVYKIDNLGGVSLVQEMISPNQAYFSVGAFGSSLREDNGVLFVGAPAETIIGQALIAVGKVYSYTRNGTGTYSPWSDYEAPVRTTNAVFGTSMAVTQGTLVVGAWGETLDSLDTPVSNGGVALDSAGAAYIFEQCIHANIPQISSVNSSLSVCQGDSIQLVIAPSDTLNSSREWFWYENDYATGTLIDSTDTVWLKPTVTTTYKVAGEGYCVAARGSDSVGSITINVIANPTISIAATPNDTICMGDQVTLTASGATSYVWDNGVTNGTPFTPNTTTTYKVVGTGFGGCKDSADIQVVVNPVPTVTINYTGSTTICSGTSVLLSGSGASSYTWDNGVVDGVAFVPTATTTYTVTGTTTQGCSDTESITINVVPGPTVTIAAATTTVCEGDPVSFSASGADTYAWNNGLGAGATQTVTATTTTTYQVVGTQNTTGCTDTADVTITVNPLPNVVANASPNDSVCLGETVTLFGSGANTYQWNNGVVDGVAFTPSLGTVQYIVTGTDLVGCVNKDTIDIVVSPLPTIGASGPAGPFCSGNSITLNGTGGVSYVWDNGVQDGVAFTPPVGTNVYTVIGTDANGCQGSAVFSVTVNQSPTVSAFSSAGGAVLCEGDTLTLTATGTGQSYVWDNGVQDGSPFVPTVGTHVYTVTATSANMCTATASVSVVVAPQDDATITPVMPLCGNVPAVILESQTSGGTWQGQGIVNSTTGEFDASVAGQGVHQIVYTTAGVCSDSDTIDIEVYPALIINGYSDSVCYGDVDGEVRVEVVQGVAPYTYLWDNDETTTLISGLGEGTYSVTVTDANNCVETTSVAVTLTENCDYHIFLPTIFSPNGDGNNDVFYVRGKGFEELQFLVYDRWGNKMFESTDKEIGWDGKYQGKNVPAGVYVYYVSVKYYGGESVVKEGNICVAY